MDDKTVKAIVASLGDGEDETPEQRAEREQEAARWKAESEKRQREAEEAVRMAVPRSIESLRKEASEKLSEAGRLEAMLKEYPNLRRHTGRWNKVAYYSKDVNGRVTDYDIRHNCGCCNDSPLEVWPYVQTPAGKVYSDPAMFRVGEREPLYGGDIPYKGWDKEMRDAGIPEGLIKRVSHHFRKEADEAMDAAARIYGGDGDGSS